MQHGHFSLPNPTDCCPVSHMRRSYGIGWPGWSPMPCQARQAGQAAQAFFPSPSLITAAYHWAVSGSWRSQLVPAPVKDSNLAIQPGCYAHFSLQAPWDILVFRYPITQFHQFWWATISGKETFLANQRSPGYFLVSNVCMFRDSFRD